MTNALRNLAPLAWRNIWRNPRRTVITLTVVSVGLWSILFFNSFLNAWSQSSEDTALGLLTGSGQIHAPGYMDDPTIETLFHPPDAALRKALNAPEIKDWTMRLAVPAVVQSEYKTLPVTFMGVDPDAERRLSTIPGKLIEGRYLQSAQDDSIILGRHLAERLKTGPGRRVIVMSLNTQGNLSEQSFDVVGLYDADQATEDFYVFSGLAAGQKFLGLKDEIAEIVVTLNDGVALAPAFAALQDAAPDLDVRTWKDLNLFLATTDAFMASIIYIWLGVVFSLMAIGIVNTQLMAVFERTREFGLLGALGMKPWKVLILVSVESAMLIGLGVLLGMAFSALTIWLLYDGIDLGRFALALEMFQGGQVFYPKYDPQVFVLFSAMIWLMGILVSLWPAWRASKCSPIEAMRRET